MSLRIVLSTNPADARASTNPANTSVSKSASSSSLVGTRCPRRSRTTARANPRPLDFTQDEETSSGQLFSQQG